MEQKNTDVKVPLISKIAYGMGFPGYLCMNSEITGMEDSYGE